MNHSWTRLEKLNQTLILTLLVYAQKKYEILRRVSEPHINAICTSLTKQHYTTIANLVKENNFPLNCE